MRANIRRHPSPPAACLALLPLALLSGCDAVQDAISHGRALAAPAKFGTATREQLDTDPEGRTFRMTIASTAPATWLEADRALFDDLQYQCVDGERAQVVSETPAPAAGQGSVEPMRHPAGTTFVRIYRCQGSPGEEFAIAAGVGREEAIGLVRARLVDDAGYDPRRHIVMPVAYSDRNRKYPAMERALGTIMATAFERCGQGATLKRVVIGAYPRAADAGKNRLNRGEIILGVDITCRDADARAP